MCILDHHVDEIRGTLLFGGALSRASVILEATTRDFYDPMDPSEFFLVSLFDVEFIGQRAGLPATTRSVLVMGELLDTFGARELHG